MLMNFSGGISAVQRWRRSSLCFLPPAQCPWLPQQNGTRDPGGVAVRALTGVSPPAHCREGSSFALDITLFDVTWRNGFGVFFQKLVFQAPREIVAFSTVSLSKQSGLMASGRQEEGKKMPLPLPLHKACHTFCIPRSLFHHLRRCLGVNEHLGGDQTAAFQNYGFYSIVLFTLEFCSEPPHLFHCDY